MSNGQKIYFSESMKHVPSIDKTHEPTKQVTGVLFLFVF